MNHYKPFLNVDWVVSVDWRAVAIHHDPSSGHNVSICYGCPWSETIRVMQPTPVMIHHNSQQRVEERMFHFKRKHQQNHVLSLNE